VSPENIEILSAKVNFSMINPYEKARGDVSRTTFLFFKISCCQEQREEKGIIKMRDTV
jgi:hypothetical protein